MRVDQARGYLLEFVVLDLLTESGYIEVEEGLISGRGANHQIDAHGILSIPTAFLYPIRLLSESKFKKSTIGLPTIRNFVGVVKDISENYYITSEDERNTPYRYTDVGCIFSATSFSIEAQKYAWAHNIPLISFYKNPKMEEILANIDTFTESIPTDHLKVIRKKELIEKFRMSYVRSPHPTLVVGILDNTYPLVLAGNNGWLARIPIPDNTDTISGVKDSRRTKRNELIINLKINEELVYFNLSKFVAKQLINKIDRTPYGEHIFNVIIPMKKKTNRDSINRILKIGIRLPSVIRIDST